MRAYCTLFDSHYLARGLLMAQSLRSVSEAHVYVLCMDQPSFVFLSAAQWPGITPISLQDFEDDALQRAKTGRSKSEYCWTCTPALILHCLDRFALAECTYVDADLYFYRDPSVLHNRMGGAKILITPHRYASYCDRTAIAGIFCVQYMTFNGAVDGRTALTWWRDRCLEWCYAKAEEGKFGDQKYLDDWPKRFSGVHVEETADVGVAPWNIADYQCDSASGPAGLRHAASAVNPVFYHFHGLKLWRSGHVDFGTNYRIPSGIADSFYGPYIRQLLACNEKLPDFLQKALFESDNRPRRLWLKRILWATRGTNNFARIERFRKGSL